MTSHCAVIVRTNYITGNIKLHGHQYFEICRFSNKLLEITKIKKPGDHGDCNTFPN